MLSLRAYDELKEAFYSQREDSCRLGYSGLTSDSYGCFEDDTDDDDDDGCFCD